ncbi:MAG: hypothetical protein AVDCRST_MAG93-7755, partial [uncultured Chloroflexia bacterium]
PLAVRAPPAVAGGSDRRRGPAGGHAGGVAVDARRRQRHARAQPRHRPPDRRPLRGHLLRDVPDGHGLHDGRETAPARRPDRGHGSRYRHGAGGRGCRARAQAGPGVRERPRAPDAAFRGGSRRRRIRPHRRRCDVGLRRGIRSRRGLEGRDQAAARPRSL